MNCPNCRTKCNGRYCSKCGTKIEDYTEHNNRKHITIIVTICILAVITYMVYFADSHMPLIDPRLLGTWQSRDNGYYVDSWTFNKDGSYITTRITLGDSFTAEGYYLAEGGKLKLSFSKNIETYLIDTYDYQIGESNFDLECLVLTKYESSGLISDQFFLFRTK